MSKSAATEAAWSAVVAIRNEQSQLANSTGVKGKRAKMAALEARHQAAQNAWLHARAAK